MSGEEHIDLKTYYIKIASPWSQRSAFGVLLAILEDETMLTNLTEVTAGSSKGEERQAVDDTEPAVRHQESFSIATD